MKLEFLEIVRTRIKREGIHDLLEWLEGTDWYEAPASSRFHLAKEGGLLEHSLNVYHRLLRLCEMEFGEINSEMHESIAIAALFHDFTKIDFYKPEWRNVKVYHKDGTKFDNGGRFDWESKQGYSIDEKLNFGYHGPKSLYLIERFIRLTEEEAVAVACHMGAFDRPQNDFQVSNAFEKNTLALLLHFADCMASFIDERE